jgi:hypothetical protein
VNLTSFGLPIGPNDTLEIHFTVNAGRGPPVNFEIHTHGGVTGYLRFFNASGANFTGSWKVPWNDSYMVWFVNPSPIPVNVTYSFVLFAPPNDLTPLIIFPLAIGGAVGWFLWLRAGRDAQPQAPDPTDRWRDDDRPKDEAPASDQAPP